MRCIYCENVNEFEEKDGYATCLECFNMIRILNGNDVDKQVLERVGSVRFNKYSRNAYFKKHLTDLKIEDIDDRKRIENKFDEIQRQFKSLKLKRKNLLPTKYLIKKIIELLKMEYKIYVRIKSRKTLQNYETIWNKMVDKVI